MMTRYLYYVVYLAFVIRVSYLVYRDLLNKFWAYPRLLEMYADWLKTLKLA